MTAWYRSTGEAEGEDIPDSFNCEFKNLKNDWLLTLKFRKEAITHLYVKDVIDQPLNEYAPNVAHLKLEGLSKDQSQLDW